MSSRQQEKQRLRAERLAREQAQARGATRRRRMALGTGALLVVIAAVVVVLVATGGSSSSSKTTAAPNPGGGVLASTAGAADGTPVDGIKCETQEQVLFHIHAHLAVFVDRRGRAIPQGIGIAPPRTEQQTPDGPFVTNGKCFYWLHSHTADGIIHIESPIQRTFTLGNYFDIWHQPLSATQVGPAHGTVTAYVNSHRFSGDPREIPLKAHELVQLDVGGRVPPAPFVFPEGL